MHITGERQIPAPRERVWRALADATLLQGCIPDSRIGPDEDSLILSGIGTGSVRAKPTVREPFTTLGWRIDPMGAATQMALIRLTEQGVYTVLSYELSLADPEGTDPEGKDNGIRTANLQARIDQVLERFVHTVAGTAEIGAGGIAGAVQAATEPSAQPNASMRATPSAAAGANAGAGAATVAAGGMPGEMSRLVGMLNPSIIGGVLFLVVVLFMLGIF